MTQVLDYSASNSTTEQKRSYQVGRSSVYEIGLTSRRIYRTRLSSFKNLVNQRKDYLKNLYRLGPNWCSGNSQAPETSSIDLMSRVLDDLEKNTSLLNTWNRKSKLLMGPLPQGGVSLEIKHFNFMVMLNILNSKEVELEYEVNGYYHEIENLSVESVVQETTQIISKLIEDA